MIFALSAAGQSQQNLKKWLNEEVVWIIGPGEKKAFQALKTDQEKAQFVEEFWEKRDPSPGTLKNEFKEEHYRRLQFVAKEFREGIPSWRTDRGRVYIIQGAPISRTQEMDQEIWLYGNLPGALYRRGAVELVFTRAGVSGKTAPDSHPLSSTRNPSNRYSTTSTSRYRLTRAYPQGGVNAFDISERIIADALRSPGKLLEARLVEEEHRKEALETARFRIETKTSFEKLSIQLATAIFPGPEYDSVVFAVSLPRSALHFSKSVEGQVEAAIDLECRLLAPDGYLVDSIADTLHLGAPEEGTSQIDLYYSNEFRVSEQDVTLDCVALEQQTGKVGLEVAASLNKPRPERNLALSSLVLTQTTLRRDSDAEHPLNYSDVCLQLPAQPLFQQTKPLLVYLRVHDPVASSAARDYLYDYRIYDSQKIHHQAPFRALKAPPGPLVPLGIALDLSQLEPGEYTLQLKVHDRATREVKMRSKSFTLVP
jgi:GWxTD domain-containing protein